MHEDFIFACFEHFQSTLRASVLRKMPKNHPKIHENRWKFANKMLSLKLLFMVLDAFFTQKTSFNCERSFFVTRLHLKGSHHCYIWAFQNIKKIEKREFSIFFEKAMKIHQNCHPIFNYRCDWAECALCLKKLFNYQDRCKRAHQTFESRLDWQILS